MTTRHSFFAVYYHSLIIVATPLIFLPILIYWNSMESRCAFVLLIMSCYWMTEAVPLPATALIPIFAFPLLGVSSTKDMSRMYLKETNMLFVGGLMVAVAVEFCGLHKRIALVTLLRVGQTPGRLLLGFMIASMFLSMWISNTAATAMMTPMVEAVLMELNSETVSGHNGIIDAEKSKRFTAKQQRNTIFRHILYLGLCYASNLGGTSTITGTNPNLVLNGFLESWYGEKTGITYASWMALNIPGMVLCTIVGYVWLRAASCVLNGTIKTEVNAAEESRVRKMILQKYQELGSMTFHEWCVLFLFTVLVILWVFREPQFIPGWLELFRTWHGNEINIHSATPAILIAFMLFVIPADPFKRRKNHACLTWKILHEKLPWGVILLQGGGFALAVATQESGLSVWLGNQLKLLSFLPKVAIVIVVCVITALFTEFISNTAAASILLPVLNVLALSIEVNPLYLLVPVTLCCSYAFMLPVATPPNAIIFDAAKTLTIKRMAFIGVGMNLICICITLVLLHTYATLFIDLQHLPKWANITILN